MSSDGSIKTGQDDDLGADFSDDGTSQNIIKKKGKVQNKTRCQRYSERNKKKMDAIVSSQVSKHTAITVDEEEKIKRRKEYDKEKSKRYRDRKRAKLMILRKNQASKTVVMHVTKCQNCHKTQIAGPSTRNVAYVPPNLTADLSTCNESNIPESHSDSDGNIHNNTPSEDNDVPQLHEPIITIFEPNSQNILPSDVQNNTQLKMSAVVSKRLRQDIDEGEYSFDDGTSQDEIEDIKKKKDLLNSIRYQQNRGKKKTDVMICSDFSKYQTPTVETEEEKIKRRKEYDKQKSQRYRDKKRAIKLINLLTAQSTKTVVTHVSKCQNCPNSQIAGPSTRDVPYVLPINTDLSTLNEPYIPGSHSDSDDDIHNDTPPQVNYVPQLHEPIITIYESNTQNILPCDVQNSTELEMSSDGCKRKRQANDERADFSDDSTSQIE